MEPASQNKDPRQHWKTEPFWDHQEWGRPIQAVRPIPEVQEQPDCSPAPKALGGGDEAVLGPAKALKVEPPDRHEEDGSIEDPEFPPKKKAIWKILGNTSYPLVPKWTSYQKDSKGAYSFPAYSNHGFTSSVGLKKEIEESSEAVVPAKESCKFGTESLSKPKAVFSPMLNSLLTLKTPVPEPIQESVQKPMLNHCTGESVLALKEEPNKKLLITSVQSTPPPASVKPRGPYRAKGSPGLKHSIESTTSVSGASVSGASVSGASVSGASVSGASVSVASDSVASDSVASDSGASVSGSSVSVSSVNPEAGPKSSTAPVNSLALESGESVLRSQSEKSSDQKPPPDSRLLLIDDHGVPYTMMKKESVEEKPPVPKKLHYCLVCYRTFLYLSDLERHSITHSEHKPFECKACGKTFKRSSHLQRHKHIHTGERPFICPICEKGFRESGELHRHQRVHTGEKPFQCELCHLRFTERNTLRRHIKRKHTLDNLSQQDSDNLSDWGEAFTETPDEEEDKKNGSDQALSDNAQKSPPQSSPSLH